jgi:drug/metabolite transporter (DMT)-like permease
MSVQKNLRAAYAALAVITLLWSSNWLAMKAALRWSDPMSFNLQRIAVAIVVLFAVLAWQRRPFWPQDWRAVLVTGFFQTTINMGAVTMGLASGGAGRTSILVFTMPFWTLLLAWPVLHERVRGAQWLAVAAAFVGLVLVVEPWEWHGSLAPKLWPVLSGFGWAAGTVAMRHYQRKRAYDPLNFIAWQMLAGYLPLMLVPLLFDLPGTRWSATYVLLLFYVGALATAVGFVLWLRVLRDIPAGTATLNTFAIPVLALAMSMVVYGERLTGNETLGIVAIAFGLAVITLRALRANQLAAR